MKPEDLMVIEGGNRGGKETVWWMEEIVHMVRGKINKRPIVVRIPMRQDKEGQ